MHSLLHYWPRSRKGANLYIHTYTHREGGKYSRMVPVLVNIDLIYKIHMEDREKIWYNILECFFWSVLKNRSLSTAYSRPTVFQLRGMSPGHIPLGDTMRKQRLKADCIQTNNFREKGYITSLSVALSAEFIMNESRRLSLYPRKLDMNVRHLEKTTRLHCEVNCILKTW